MPAALPPVPAPARRRVGLLLSPLRRARAWFVHAPRAIQIGFVLTVLAGIAAGGYYRLVYQKQRAHELAVAGGWRDYEDAVAKCDVPATRAALDRILAVNPGDPDALFRKASLEAGAAEPDDADLAALLLIEHARHDQIGEAAREARKVLARYPKNWRSHCILAHHALAVNHDAHEARRWLDALPDPDDPAAQLDTPALLYSLRLSAHLGRDLAPLRGVIARRVLPGLRRATLAYASPPAKCLLIECYLQAFAEPGNHYDLTNYWAHVSRLRDSAVTEATAAGDVGTLVRLGELGPRSLAALAQLRGHRWLSDDRFAVLARELNERSRAAWAAVRAKEPDRPESYCALAAIAADEGDRLSALEIVSQGREVCGDRTELLQLLTRVTSPPAGPPAAPAEEREARDAFRRGDFETALALIRAAAGANPALNPPRLTLSRWCREASQPAAAREMLEQAARDDPAHPAVFLTNAGYALDDNRLADAILNGEAALRAADDKRWQGTAGNRFRREARLALATAWERRDDHGAARTHLLALVELDPKNPQHRVQLARAEFALGRPEAALAVLREAFGCDPALDPPEVAMAQLWARAGDHPTAEEWYRRAVRAHPDSAKAHRAYASFLLDRGRRGDAKPHLERAANLEPDDRDTLALRGLLARHEKDYLAATRVFEGLVRDHPTFAFATANLALALAESDDPARRRRAVALAEALVCQSPTSTESRGILAYCLSRSGRSADAEKAAAAIAPARLTADAAYLAARVLSERGRADEARTLLTGALGGRGAFVYREEAQTLLARLGR